MITGLDVANAFEVAVVMKNVALSVPLDIHPFSALRSTSLLPDDPRALDSI